MKVSSFVLLSLLVCSGAFAQTDEQKVKDVLLSYKNALEKLDVKGTDILFVANSQIID